MTADQKLEALAWRIARRLFTDGQGRRAKRLVFEFEIVWGGPDHRIDGIGWSELCVQAQVLETIKQAIRDDEITRKQGAKTQTLIAKEEADGKC